MGMTTTALHPVPAPKYAQFQVFDCRRCGHEELLHPVFLSDGGSYGTGCAANLLGTTGREAAQAQIAAESHFVIEVCRHITICRPGRITAAFVRHLNERYNFFGDADKANDIDRAIALWKAAK